MTTEIILFGSKKHLVELNIKSLSVAWTDVSVASQPVWNLGAIFDPMSKVLSKNLAFT